ncbi:MAG: response regulator transcription factor [Luteibaculaceae bacterium]
MHVLLVEDDHRISDFVIKGLEENGFTVSHAQSGEKAQEMLSEHTFDLLILDIMLPGIDGIQLTQIIRYKKIKTPILALSALSELDDRVTALDQGADDYLTKPFHFKELISRINALTRRVKNSNEIEALDRKVISFGNLEINLNEYTVKKNGVPLELSPKEFKLLTFLLENKNKAVSRQAILKAVWDINFDNQTNAVDVYVSYLRNKIDESKDNSLIQTVKGVGYMIKSGT